MSAQSSEERDQVLSEGVGKSADVKLSESKEKPSARFEYRHRHHHRHSHHSRPEKRGQRERKKLVIAVAVVALVCAAFFYVASQLDSWLSPKSSAENDASSSVRVFDGEKYRLRPKSEIVNFLIIGIDAEKQEIDKGSYYCESQADFLMIISVNCKAQKTSFIQINRDTITDVDEYGIGGRYYRTVKEQIALAYTYGEGETASCQNTAKAVSGLFYGIRIDYYAAVALDSLPILAELIGDVTLTLDQDLTAVNPSWTIGSTVTLDRTNTEAFLRSRMNLADPTNTARMARQRQYMEAIIRNFKSQETTVAFWNDAFTKMGDGIITNCTAQAVSLLADYIRDYTCEDIVTPAGESKLGSRYMEFYPDETQLQALVTGWFYEKES